MAPGSEAVPRHPTKRYLQLLAASAVVWGIFTLVLELAFPTKEFFVFSTCSSLYGEGGGLFTHLLRALGGFLLFKDVPAGICLTAFTMFIQVTCLPPFAWFCLLRPQLGRRLMESGLKTTMKRRIL